MKIIRKILFPFFSLFLIYKSYEIIEKLLIFDVIILSPKESLLISFLLNLYITGVFAFIGFAYPSSRIMPDSYYRLKNSHLLSRSYRLMGVNYYRSLLLILFWGSRKNRQKYFNGTRTGLRNFIYQTRQSEFGHLWAFISILILSIILLVKGYLLASVLSLVFNLLGNLYPTILQRYHRIRIDKLNIPD